VAWFNDLSPGNAANSLVRVGEAAGVGKTRLRDISLSST
jgi:hypothetical protein